MDPFVLPERFELSPDRFLAGLLFRWDTGACPDGPSGILPRSRLQKPESNRHVTPCRDAAFPVGPFCRIVSAFRQSRYSDSNRDLMITDHLYLPLYDTGIRTIPRAEPRS